jgi:hypothetical protein
MTILDLIRTFFSKGIILRLLKGIILRLLFGFKTVAKDCFLVVVDIDANGGRRVSPELCNHIHREAFREI